MLLAGVVACASLLVAPPEEIPVQRPSTQGAERRPSVEPEPEPADAATETPGPTDPAPAEPETPTSSAIVPLGSTPLEPGSEVEPAPASDGAGITSWRDAAPAPERAEWPRDQLDVEPPAYRGTGLFVSGGALFGAVLLKQALSPIFCDADATMNCGSVGWIDRSLIAGAIGLIGGAGWQRGAWAADAGNKQVPAATVRRRKIAGWTLAGVGFAGIAVDFGFAAACWQSGVGPYAIVDEGSPFIVRCRSTATGLFFDASGILAGAGMGVGLWANAYAGTSRRKRARAHFEGVAPVVSRDAWGLRLGGRF